MDNGRSKSALITGATGKDGAYLAELLLGKGYVVHGITRRSSSFNTARIDHLYRGTHEEGVRFHLRYADVTEATNLIRIVQKTQLDGIYNLAATPIYPYSPCAAVQLYAHWLAVWRQDKLTFGAPQAAGKKCRTYPA